MMTASEKRKDRRINQSGTILVSDETANHYIYAKIGNISGDGIYFESEHPIKPGRKIKIRYDNPPFKSLPKNYCATVLWCRRLSESESTLPFGIGATFQ